MSSQCNTPNYVVPAPHQRIIVHTTSDLDQMESYYSTSIGNAEANIVELQMVQGHWHLGVGSDYANFPAIVVRALTANQLIGAEYFTLAFVLEGVQEWSDNNTDGIVEPNEFVGPFQSFANSNYAWAFSNANTGNIFTLTLTATGTGLPTVSLVCALTMVDYTSYNGFNISGNQAKCDISITNLVLTDKTDSWALRTFIVGRSKNIFLSGRPATPVGSGMTAGRMIETGAGGSIQWVSHAGTTSGGVDLEVSFNGTTGAGTSYAGSSFYDAVQANFGFPNPSPGSDYGIYWDPILGAPEASGVSKLVPSLIVVACVIAAWL